MTRRIHVLPDSVANQIAAGEVVERPASVVKELVENSLDARATRVEVAVERGGKRRIRISDDGIGMSREDALLSLDRHATSKITRADDLRGVRTFGFRGEAMPSIAAVSRMVIETYDGDGDAGTRVAVNGGGVSGVDDVARRRGTTVDVKALFYNAPARSKFQKSTAAETRAVSEVMTTLALANPRVAFVLTSDGRSLLDLSPSEDAAGRVAAIWPGEESGTLIPVIGADDASAADVRGLIQRPDAARPGLRRAHVFVNGRPVSAAHLVRAAEAAYRTTVPHGARPWMFLYVQVPADDVDVNVHPAKAEVRFRRGAEVEAAVEAAVRGALEQEPSSATFDSQLAPPPMAVRERGPSEGPKAPAGGAGQADPADQMALFASVDRAPAGATSSAEAPPPMPSGRPRLWQALRTYILAETRDGLLIVDQHSAHERILFERLMSAFERGGQEGQRLLFPLTLRLTRAEYDVVEELGGLLSRAGFEVEGFGGDTVIVQAVPNPHPWFDAERSFREMVHDLANGSELSRSARNQHERIASVFACKSAIKAGQRLDDREMQELFDQLFATELPHHDVHGRPTVVRLSAKELHRRFDRGSTHG